MPPNPSKQATRRVPPVGVRAEPCQSASDTTGQDFMTQLCQFENGLEPLFLGFAGGCTVSRKATSVDPSKTSRRWLQVKQRNSPFAAPIESNSMRR
jgi:hypothetical protein